MSEPWSTDRDLDAARALRAVRAHAPLSEARVVELLGSGWDYDAYLVDGHTVVRFPRRAEVAERLDLEVEILGFVRDAVGDAVPVPTVTVQAEAGPHFPYAFLGHAYLSGVPADDSRARPAPELAGDLGRALSALHAVSPEACVAAGLGTEDETVRERYDESVAVLRGRDDVTALTPGPVAWLLGAPNVPPEHGGPRRLIHNDLCPDHILLDAEGRLAGMLDWSDVALGDPALDFVTLVHWRGRAFTEEVLAHYAPDLDRGFRTRLGFLARVLGLKWLGDALRRGGDVDKHVAWVGRAFEEEATRRDDSATTPPAAGPGSSPSTSASATTAPAPAGST